MRPAGGSPLWRSRLRGTRLEVSETHDDFPPLLAESLDRYEQLDGRLPDLAAELGTTVSPADEAVEEGP